MTRLQSSPPAVEEDEDSEWKNAFMDWLWPSKPMDVTSPSHLTGTNSQTLRSETPMIPLCAENTETFQPPL